MALTQLTLCNLALSKIGNEGVQITHFTNDTGKAARQCRLHYTQTLNELVRMHTWNCTKFRAELVLSITDPIFGWDYSYVLPSGCLRPVALTADSSTQRLLRFNDEWIIESNFIFSNSATAWLSYIKAPAEADMDPLFAAAFYTLLASKLAIPVMGDRDIAKDMLEEFYSVIMPEARRVNGFEGYESPVVDSEWLQATGQSEPYRGFGAVTWEGTLP